MSLYGKNLEVNMEFKTSENIMSSENGLIMQENFSSTVQFNMDVKLTKALDYWNEKFSFLVSERFLVFTLLKDNKFFKIQNTNFFSFLIKEEYIEYITDLSRLYNSNYIFIGFKNKTNADLFKSNVSVMENAKVVFVETKREKNCYQITAEGLPSVLLAEKIPPLLRDIGIIDKISWKKIKLPSGNIINSEPLSFEITMNDTLTMEDIPIYININANKIYLKVKGRPKVCYKCDTIGHIATDCDSKMCFDCHRIYKISHKCYVSYADKIKITPASFEKLKLEMDNLKEKENSIENQGNLEDLTMEKILIDTQRKGKLSPYLSPIPLVLTPASGSVISDVIRQDMEGAEECPDKVICKDIQGSEGIKTTKNTGKIKDIGKDKRSLKITKLKKRKKLKPLSDITEKSPDVTAKMKYRLRSVENDMQSKKTMDLMESSGVEASDYSAGSVNSMIY